MCHKHYSGLVHRELLHLRFIDHLLELLLLGCSVVSKTLSLLLEGLYPEAVICQFVGPQLFFISLQGGDVGLVWYF